MPEYTAITAQLAKHQAPKLCLQVSEEFQKMSVIEAKQFAIGIISMAERATILDKIYNQLEVLVGQDEARNIIKTLGGVLEDEI